MFLLLPEIGLTSIRHAFDVLDIWACVPPLDFCYQQEIIAQLVSLYGYIQTVSIIFIYLDLIQMQGYT